MATTVKVKSGDTMSALAKKAGVSLKAFIAANPQITNPSLIRPGQVLNIPAATPAKTTSAPTSGVIPGFTPSITMPTPAKQPGDTGFVGPVAIPTETAFIYNAFGTLEEVYTTGPKAGTSVATGMVVFQSKPGSLTREEAEKIKAGESGNTPPAPPKPSEKYAGIVALLSSYGIDKIADMVDKVLTDYPESDGDEVLNLLRYDQRYNKPYLDRFAGNAARLKNKMPLLSEDVYLQQEMGYSKMFKSYGLTNLDNREQYARLIAADVDIPEATTRVSMAYDRVLKADPSTKNAFLRFFPMLSNQDLVAAMLNPEEQLPALERKVQSAEIGGAALRQGLIAELADTTTKSTAYSNVQAGTVGAGTLETAGVSAAGAAKSYGTIASELPTMEKLSSVYGSTMEQYGQREAEQAELLGLASAKRKKERLVAREEAQFQGRAGTARGSFSSENSF
jgi:murein DD-endopeptidase MepM/ murein hydrolase activator NlpD